MHTGSTYQTRLRQIKSRSRRHEIFRLIFNCVIHCLWIGGLVTVISKNLAIGLMFGTVASCVAGYFYTRQSAVAYEEVMDGLRFTAIAPLLLEAEIQQQVLDIVNKEEFPKLPLPRTFEQQIQFAARYWSLFQRVPTRETDAGHSVPKVVPYVAQNHDW